MASTGEAGAVEGEAVEGAEDRDGDLAGLEILAGEGLELLAGDGFDAGEDFVEREETSKISSWRARLDMRELVDSSESMSEPLRWFFERRNSSSVTSDSFKARNS